MAAQRQAHRNIVFDHLLALAHRAKLHGGFHNPFAVHISGKQRQRGIACQRAGSPKRLAPRQAKGGKGIGFRQAGDSGGRDPCPAPDILDRDIAIAPRGNDPKCLVLGQAFYLAKA